MSNPDGSSDKNLIELDVSKGSTQDFTSVVLQADSSYTGIFKYTSKQKGPLTVIAGTAIGAKETVVDVNNEASNLTIKASLWDVSACKYGFSNKGGALNNKFVGTIKGRSKECEFFQDNWSDQNHSPCKGTELDLKPEDGVTPIRIRYLYEKPKLVTGSGPYEFVFPGPNIPGRWFIFYGFNTLRRLGFFR